MSAPLYILSDSPCSNISMQITLGKGQTGDRLHLSLDCSTFSPQLSSACHCTVSCIVHHHQHSYSQINNVASMRPLLSISQTPPTSLQHRARLNLIPLLYCFTSPNHYSPRFHLWGAILSQPNSSANKPP